MASTIIYVLIINRVVKYTKPNNAYNAVYGDVLNTKKKHI